MGLFKRKTRVPFETGDLSNILYECEEKRDFFLAAVQGLLLIIKSFSIDAEELDSERFKRGIENLSKRFQSKGRLKSIRSFFEKRKKDILSYVARHGQYLIERETEFKEITDVLTKAVATINMESLEFSEKIYEQSEKIEQITQLEDLKKIKTALKQEIEHVRETVREKQLHDEKRIETLSKKVAALDAELKNAERGGLRDGLTGVYNVGAFDRYMEDTVERNPGGHSSFSMLVLDVDNLEGIVDTYGRKMADRIILAIAQKCQEFIGSHDFIARHKEGLFVIVFPGQPLKDASKKAKRLCESIAQNRYSVDDVQAGHVLSFTVSIGLSTYSKGENADRVTQRALKGLYAAKRSGGDRVVTEKARFLLFRRDKVETIEPL